MAVDYVRLVDCRQIFSIPVDIRTLHAAPLLLLQYRHQHQISSPFIAHGGLLDWNMTLRAPTQPSACKFPAGRGSVQTKYSPHSEKLSSLPILILRRRTWAYGRCQGMSIEPDRIKDGEAEMIKRCAWQSCFLLCKS
jgi:hypothetical protein